MHLSYATLQYCNSLWKLLICRFDYIARDCRACGLGCNFEFQRFHKFLLNNFLSVFDCLDHFLNKLQVYNIQRLYITSTSEVVKSYRLMETMRVLDDEICYRAKEC